MNWYKISKNKPKKDVTFEGTLRQNKDKFVYLDCDDRISDSLRKMLTEDGIKKPPSDEGAHISVFYADEMEEHDLKIKELNKKFPFIIKEVYSVNPDGWDEMERVWFVKVISPELEALRQKYGLSKKLNGHEFHITFAVKEKN